MSSIMGEVILHSTLEEYRGKVKPKVIPKPHGKIHDQTPIPTVITSQQGTVNPDADLGSVDYRGLSPHYGHYGDGNFENNYESKDYDYESLDAYLDTVDYGDLPNAYGEYDSENLG